MTDYLYGYDASSVVTDTAGNTYAGRTGVVHTTFTGSTQFPDTKAVNPVSLGVGDSTGGVVVSDSAGRIGLYAVDYLDTLYVDFGDGTRWPLNPTKQSEAIGAALDMSASALSGKVEKGTLAFRAADYGASPAATSAVNSAAILAAVNAAAGAPVYLGPGRYAAAVELTDQHINITGPGVLVQAPGTVALSVKRTWGDPLSVTVAPVTFGPNSPPEFTYTQTLSQLTVTGGNYAQFTGGDLYHLCSNDAYGWSVAAIGADSNVWRAEFFPVLGVALDVTGLANGGPVESVAVKGATSNAQGLVSSVIAMDASSAKVTFAKVSADFTPGENLLRVSDNVLLGVAGAMGLVMAGTLAEAYTTTPQLRRVDRSKVCNLDVNIDTQGDPDAYLVAAQRLQSVVLEGVYAPRVRAHIVNGYTRAVVVKSCYRADVDARIDGLPNHIEAAQQAYGYGVELRGCTEGASVRVVGSNLRHAFTTNPNGATWGPTKAKEYGTVKHNTVRDSLAINCLAAGFDTHAGAYFTTFDSCRTVNAGSANRDGAAAGGFNNRGFGTITRDCHADGCLIAFKEYGVAYPSPFTYVNSYKSCSATGYQESGYYQSSDAVDDLARIDLDGCHFRGDGRPVNAPYFQHGYRIGNGRTTLRGCTASRFNGAPLLIKGTAAGHYDLDTFFADYTDSPGTSGARIDGSLGELNITRYRLHALSGAVPASFFVNLSGTTNYRIDGLSSVGSSTTSVVCTVTGGAPNFSPRSLLATGERVTMMGDASATATPRSVNRLLIWNTPLTANRTVTLPTTAGTVLNGDAFRVVRTAAATGAFNLTVGAKVLAAGQWVDIAFDGTAWHVVAAGTL